MNKYFVAVWILIELCCLLITMINIFIFCLCVFVSKFVYVAVSFPLPFISKQSKSGMGPGSSGPLPPTVNPGLPQASSGPAGIPVPSKPGVLSNSARAPSPQVRFKN